MKSKASSFIKHVLSVIKAMAKAKALALKHKTGALKTRLMIFSVLKNRKMLMSSISSKLQALTGHSGDEGEVEDQSKAANVICNALKRRSLPSPAYQDGEGDDGERFPDLTHSLFDSEDDFEDPGGSVIDIVKHSKEGGGEEFKLEDEIDQVADLFIKRFHRQMRMQKQLSLKRYQEMLQKRA
uniref:DUF761 domain-containing protein n=1 Tax=Kalanchoe fedtschenkoi TaxID=63787 RepID=A0A7N0VL84_KALFE